MAYGEKVLDHYENPRNVGSLDKDDSSVGTGMVGAPACGDVMKLQIQVGQNGVIEDAKFKTYGCGSAIASSSLLTEWVKGKTLDEASQIKNSEIAEELALPPVKIHCSVLAEDAIQAAISDYQNKQAEQKKSAQDMSISLTETAADRVRNFLAQRGKGIGVRLGVKTTGCSGMAYTIEFADQVEEGDEVFEQRGVKVIINPKSLVYLDGTELDFAKEGLNEGFKFNNPNEKDRCGCGESFTVQTAYTFPSARQKYINLHADNQSVTVTESSTMEFDFSQNYFEVFQLATEYTIDPAELAVNYQQLQSQYHPDRFINSAEQDKRLAMQITSYINESGVSGWNRTRFCQGRA